MMQSQHLLMSFVREWTTGGRVSARSCSMTNVSSGVRKRRNKHFAVGSCMLIAALNLALNIPIVDHTSLSGPEHQREIWIYNFRSTATRFPLVLGFLLRSSLRSRRVL